MGGTDDSGRKYGKASGRHGRGHGATSRHARVVPASEARGLEFDGVVVVDPEEIRTARPCGERDLYVALTRATKRLCTVTVEPA